MTEKAFTITGGKGFRLSFPNGYSVSVQFGRFAYGDRHAKPFDRPEFVTVGPHTLWRLI